MFIRMYIRKFLEVNYLLLVSMVLGILFFSSLLSGRIFCGFICPLGALQEIISRFSFKSDLKAQNGAKLSVEVSSQVSSKIVGFSLEFCSSWQPFGALTFFQYSILFQGLHF